MRKYAYLARLEELLAALPAEERQDALNYYEEYFDAAGSEQEEKTAEALGDPTEVARKILEGRALPFRRHRPRKKHLPTRRSRKQSPGRKPPRR